MEKTNSGNSTEGCFYEDCTLKDPTVPPAAAKIHFRLWREKRLTITSLCNAHDLRDVPRSTVKHHLRLLVARGYVQRHGRGKGTWYTL
ncbi:MAG: winged helix-turn-helix transcriptional regulator [Alphaproteobacteria bacterium]|nr:winged helix-turn-helix domain-containing protein [Alphaproteobacteria bacterium]MDE2336096.1 winged helix-turn-helix transcriptional regulator [Alphaproteobacteria bacterium]